jgi:hypothetical protein
MELHGSRLVELDPLIAEAKRRARQRRVVLAAVLILLSAGGATLALRPFGFLRSSHSIPARLVPGGMFTGSGGPPTLYGSGSVASVSAVSAASGDDAWIIGSVAWHWDGRAWRSVPLPPGSYDLWSVAAVTPDDAWAVGARGAGYLVASHALIEHWNGARWSAVQLPRLRASFLYGVSAAGPRSVWAVGARYRANAAGRFLPSGTRPLLLHWDGTSWREWPLRWGSRPITLDKVVADGPSSVWAVSTGQEDPAGGSSVIEHWNGRRWQEVPAPFGASDPISGFGATAWNDAWAVGSYGQGGNTVSKFSYPLAAHWDGHGWRLIQVPNRSGENSAALTDVAAARPDDVWALGESQRLHLLGHDGLSATGPVALLEHWNGRRWQVAPGAAPPIFDGRPVVAATADGSAWALGACRYDNFIVRWTGRAWVFARHPNDRHRRAGTPPSVRRHPIPSCSSPAAAR